MTDSEWLDLKAKLLCESGMTLREMRKFLGGVSRQRVHQRLERIGCRPRNRKYSRDYLPWQISLIKKVRDLGFSAHEVDYLLSLPRGTAHRFTRCSGKEFRGRHTKNSSFRLNIVRTVWSEARNNILLHARASGATFREIAELAGLKGSEIALIALKRHCKGKRVS